ncbi:MAG: hypothetical protein Q9M28_07915, partial [Mariprofundaceae bacterium]|nr:hypothetical protein [Mariprofundaceae bacterium]
MIVNKGGDTLVREYEDQTFKVLRNKGETTWKYENDAIFWEWFKKKIEYQDEELVLLVITDREDFVLDEHINIAKKFTIHAAIEADLMDLKGDAKLLTF